jgi:hypothetical protein
LGGIAGTLVAVANSLLKPAAGTLSSVTWLCRGVFATINNIMIVDKGEEACTFNTLGLASSSANTTQDKQQQQNNDNISQTANAASAITGFEQEVCKQIVSEFDEIKKQRFERQLYRHKSS